MIFLGERQGKSVLNLSHPSSDRLKMSIEKLKVKAKIRDMDLMAAEIPHLQFLCDVGKIGNVQDCGNLSVKNDVEEILRGHIPLVTLLGNAISWLLQIHEASIHEASTMALIRCHSIPQMTTIGEHRSVATMNTIPSFLLLLQHSYTKVIPCNQRRPLTVLSWKLCWKWDSMTHRHHQVHHMPRDTN